MDVRYIIASALWLGGLVSGLMAKYGYLRDSTDHYWLW